MRLKYKLLTSFICIGIGIILILYAQHHLQEFHGVAPAAKSFFQRTKDFFVHLGNIITGTPEKPALPPHTIGMKIILGIGIAFASVGALLLIFCKRKD